VDRITWSILNAGDPLASEFFLAAPNVLHGIRRALRMALFSLDQVPPRGALNCTRGDLFLDVLIPHYSNHVRMRIPSTVLGEYFASCVTQIARL